MAALLKQSEIRGQERKYVDDVPCTFRDEQQRDLFAELSDVSPDGLGIIVHRPVRIGEKVQLAIGDRSIDLQIVYCHSNKSRPGTFRCGLQSSTGGREELVEIIDRLPSV